MTAIITDKIKKKLIQDIFDDALDSATYYYIGIGRSEDWNVTDTAPTPVNRDRDERLFRYSLQSIIAANTYSFVIPRYNWTSGSVYNQYNDNVSGQPAVSYYIITDENKVYLCVRQGKDSNGNAVVSTVKPTHTDISLDPETDGYIWKYLYTVTTADANNYLTANFFPVKLADSSGPLDADFNQYVVQQSAIPRQIVGYRVTAAGTGFTSDPAVTVVGNGSGARARAIVTSTGTIGAIEVDDSAGGFPHGTNYTNANIAISGGGGAGATAVPIFGPPAGLGADPRDDLRSTAIMFNVKPSGIVNGDFVVGNDFRQIGLIKNPTLVDSDELFTDIQGRGLKMMNISSATGDFAEDDIVVGGSSTARAVIDYYNDSSQIWYHQTEDTGFVSFTDGENITTTSASATADSANVAPEFDIHSGDVLYIDNRSQSITRAVGQTEDIKIIIQL